MTRARSAAAPATPRHGMGLAGFAVLLLLAVVVPTVAVPASATARAAPTVSAAPAAVVAPPAVEAAPPTAAAAAGVAVAGAAEPAGARERWTWPVDPPHELLNGFVAPVTAFAAGHRGIDLSAVPGATVRSPADGVVSFAGVVVDRPVLSIQHADDLVSSIEPVTATVGVGDRVSAGQVVGVVAAGAHCDNRCLHLGVRRHGQYISPMFFFGGIARAVLLPLPAPSREL